MIAGKIKVVIFVFLNHQMFRSGFFAHISAPSRLSTPGSREEDLQESEQQRWLFTEWFGTPKN